MLWRFWIGRKVGDLDQEDLLKKSEMSDNFVLDIEPLLSVADKDETSNSNRAVSSFFFFFF